MVEVDIKTKGTKLSCFLDVFLVSFDIATFFVSKFVCVVGSWCGFMFGVYWVLIWVFMFSLYALIGFGRIPANVEAQFRLLLCVSGIGFFMYMCGCFGCSFI